MKEKLLPYMSKRIKKTVIHSPLAFLIYLFLILLSLFMHICYHIRYFNYLVISLLFLAGFFIFKFYEQILKPIKYKIAFTLVLSLIPLFLYLYRRELVLNIIERYYLTNIISLNKLIYHSAETYFTQFLPFFILIIPLLTALFLFLNAIHKGELVILFKLALLFMIWISGLDFYLKNFLFFYLMIFFIYLAIINFEKLARDSKRKNWRNTTEKNSLLSGSTKIALAIALGTLFIISATGVKNLNQTLTDFNIRAIKKGKFIFNLSLAGYDDNESRLGGKVFLNNQLAFVVKSESPHYLRGTVKEIYNGQVWTTKHEYHAVENFNLPEFYSHIPQLILDQNRRALEIYPARITTVSFFTPLNTYEIKSSQQMVGLNQHHSFISMDKKVIEPYQITFYNLNQVDLKESDTSLKPPHNPDYLQIPEKIDPAIIELVSHLTADCRDDNEKIERIETYLRKNYTYTLNVNDLPAQADFFTHFLLTEKKGYCTYFATATVLLCRLAGIPARYVEGFRMQDNKDDEGHYTVTHNMAHAWAEARPGEQFWITVDSVPPDYFATHRYKRTRTWFRGSKRLWLKKENTRSEKQELKTGPANASPLISITRLLLIGAVLICLALIGLIIIYSYKLMHYFQKRQSIIQSKSVIPLYLYTHKRLRCLEEFENKPLFDLETVHNISDSLLNQQMTALIHAFYEEYYGDNKNVFFNKKMHLQSIEKYVKKRKKLFQYFFSLIE